MASDINDLKQLNRDYGQSRGDMTIKRRHPSWPPSFAGASIFRLSGDEFIIVSLESAYEGIHGAGQENGMDVRQPHPKRCLTGVYLGRTPWRILTG